MYPFERFTEKAKRVLTLAQEEAEKSAHSYIGTEHLLLGLLREGDGLAARVLANLGVEIDRMRSTIESLQGPGESVIAQPIIPTSRVKKVIEIAFEEAKRMNNTYVGTEHLLLGLLIQDDALAARVLAHLGVTLELVRDELARMPAKWEEGAADASPEAAVPMTRPRSWRWRAFQQWDEVFASAAEPTHPIGALSAEARSVMALAEEECLAAGRLEVAPLDLLIAAVRHGRCRAAEALEASGVSEDLLRAVARPGPPGEHPVRLRFSYPVLEAVGAVGKVGPEGAARTRGTPDILKRLLVDPNGEAALLVEGCGTNVGAVLAALERPRGY